jgi:histidinol phosphatase-like PHP family hydrolase
MTDFHMHTAFCDGTASPEVMAKAAYEKGMRAIASAATPFLKWTATCV